MANMSGIVGVRRNNDGVGNKTLMWCRLIMDCVSDLAGVGFLAEE